MQNPSRNTSQRGSLGFVVAFVVALFLALALPLFADTESALSAGVDEIGPFLVLAAVTLGLAIGGRKSALLAGIASGIIALISSVLALTVVVVLLFASWMSEFGGYDFGAGMFAIVAAVVLGFIAVIVSARRWNGSGPRAWTPVTIAGAAASVTMIVGLAIPREGGTLSQTLGFDVSAVVGLSFIAFLAILAAVGVAGFALGRFGVGLLAGFIGFILVGWATSGTGDQSTAFGWSGVDGGIDFHPLTVIGFWSAAALFVVHAIQQLSSSTAEIPVAGAPGTRPTSRRVAESVPAQWAPDPYGRAAQRYFNGRTWTSTVADRTSSLFDAPATPEPPVDGAADWYPDPLGRFGNRYFNGTEWTAQVATAGVSFKDAPVAPPPKAESASEAPVLGPPSLAAGAPAVSPPIVQDLPTVFVPAPSSSTPPPPVEVSIDATVRRPGAEPPAASPTDQPVPGESVTIRLSDGRVLPLIAAIVIGRAPSNPAEYPSAELLSTSDLTVSKSHAVVGWNGVHAWVRDLNSSNGVSIGRADGEHMIAPGAEIMIEPGDRVILGDDTSFVIDIEMSYLAPNR